MIERRSPPRTSRRRPSPPFSPRAGRDPNAVTIEQGGATIGKDVKLALGDGANSLDATNGTFDRKLTYKGRDGNDAITFAFTSIGGKASLTLGNGSNSVLTTDLGTVFGGDLAIKGGKDDDTVDLGDAAITGKFTAKLGGGADPPVVPPM